ncbi:hypothetical protein [Tautonia plasticadhaerens]|uniref:Uncharacterized protein n=1 Tax=Tautonia plasticadhaerens TaxID=2527974 RepID=A0A518GZ25_9BACT|nr:hypothetical protein [Tautonia plasticadhaerens]QDV33864.1 hypothetical protein ElP_17440 [Tautonia plasticadhaerens]
MTRIALLGLVLILPTGCDGGPDRTPTAEPVEYDDPGVTAGGGPAPVREQSTRIEMH